MNSLKISKILVLSVLLLIPLTSVTCQIVTPWLTTGDKSKLMLQQNTIAFGQNLNTANATITIDPTTSYQTMDGFGFCMTEGSAEVISTLSMTQQVLLLNELFDKSTGLGISVLRISIGASDLSSSDYSYNETSGDVNMTNFSLAGPDLNYLIPILKKVLIINPDIKILATPWTAPRWMKSNNSWIGGNLKTIYYEAYSNYFVKYLDAMKAHGIKIWAITPQNEPENPNNEPSMTMTSTEQKNFINNNLGPAMANAGYSTVKIIAFDHNCDNTAYPIDVCNNSSYVDGAAFHLYAGNISAMTTVKNATNKNVYFTEQYTASTGGFSGDLGWHLQNVVIGSANNWSKVIIEWNLANNPNIGPHTATGCTTCLGAITVNNSSTYTRNVSYYIIGQISKFVKTGAVRIGSLVSGGNINATAFKNPDGTIAVVAYNGSSSGQTVKIKWGPQTFIYTLAGSAAVTFVWNSLPNAISEISSNQFSLSPNPGHTNVTLTLPPFAGNCKSVSFINTEGKKVLTQFISSVSPETSINISGLINGVYLIKINGGSRALNGRFIKQ